MAAAGARERDEAERQEAPGRGEPPAEERAGVVPSADFKRRRRMRSIVLAVILAALVVLFYVVTIVKLGGNVVNRPL